MGERSRAAERDHCHEGIDRDPAACSIPASGHGLYSTAAYPVVVPTHENLRLEHQLCVALYNATRAITGCYRPLLDEIGLTYSQYTVMLVLWEHDTATLRDLGAALHLDSGTLSPMLKRLERAGLVSRTRGTDDERMLHVTITDAGRRIQPHASDAQRSVEETTGLDSHTLTALRDQLNDLAARTRAVPAST